MSVGTDIALAVANQVVDLRLVGLGLIVFTDGSIPLISHAHSGNRLDVAQFAELVRELITRFTTVAGHVR